MGNASHFGCPYHGKTYKNNGNLTGVPFGKALYSEQELDKKQWGCLVEKDAPQWYKESSYRSYLITFGPAGTFEQDDSENLGSITKVAKGSLASNHYLNYRMGMESGIKPLTDFPGPGIAIPSAFHEGNQRAFYMKYIEYMMKEKVKETIL